MSRTVKNEHPSDGFHVGHRLERQARQPQRDRVAFAADLALDEGDDHDWAFESMAAFELRLALEAARDADLARQWDAAAREVAPMAA